MMIRLDKYLADMGMGSRALVKRNIIKGNVIIDGIIAKRPEQKVDVSCQRVSYCGQEVVYTEYEYYMLHKPAGVVSAVSDKRDITVVDLIKTKRRKDLFPVGRLDKDTEGLMLVTNDGPLSHHLLSPKNHIDKSYYARINGLVTDADVLSFQEGLDIGDEKLTLPAVLNILKTDLPNDTSEIRITIQEGRFHQVKRMFQAVDKEVVYLKRLTMGTLVLDDNLRPGEYRALTQEELTKLC